MRFTTSSTLSKAYIFCTFALLSLIPAANADSNGNEFEFAWPWPGGGPYHAPPVVAGELYEVQWYLTLGHDIDQWRGDLLLKNTDTTIRTRTLFQGLAVADFVADVKIPDDVIQDGPPYTNYYVEFKHADDWYFNSKPFTISF